MEMDDLLIKYLLGETNPAETGQVEQWLSDEGNRARFDQFSAVWKITGQTGLREIPDPQAALRRFRRRLETADPQLDHTETPDRTRTPLLLPRGAKWRVAAVIAGLLTLATGAYLTGSVSNRPGKTHLTAKKNAAPGAAGSTLARVPDEWRKDQTGSKVRTDTLPDGSRVTLNKYSSIAYPSGWQKDGRIIHLQGEAFFAIAPNPSRPFVVRLEDDVTVKVLGTSFNVRHTTGRTEVDVETGAVLLIRGRDSVLLHPGEKGVASVSLPTKNEKLEKVKSDNLYAWYLDRPLVCDSVSLGQLVATLNEKYDAHIILRKKELNDLPLTTVFTKESLDQVLDVIAATFDLTIIRKEHIIILL